jgi:chromosome segregation ATPase
MKSKSNTSKKEAFFVAISDSMPVRTGLLESRKLVLTSMKTFAALKEIRKRKAEQKAHLRKNLRQLSSIIGHVKSKLPHIDVPSVEVMPEKKEAKKEKAKEKSKELPKVEEKKKHTEIDRIEAELAEIENKLSSLH